MRIETLNLIRYGHFSGCEMSFPKSEIDLHLVIGPNEAGKSTTRKAIVDWLYGIPARCDMNLGYEMSLLRIGGVLAREDAEPLGFVRRKGNKDTLRTLDDEVMAPGLLQPFLLGAPDREFFERMFCVDHAALRSGGERMLQADGDDRVAQALFQSAAGITGLDALLARLDEEASELWGPQAKKTRAYDQALSAYKEAKQAVDGCEVRFRRFRELEEAVVTAAELHEKGRQALEGRRRRLAQISLVRRLVTPVALLRDAESRLALLGPVRSLPLDAYRRASDAIKFIDGEEIRAKGFQSRIDEAQMNLALYETNDVVWSVVDQVGDILARKVHVLQAVSDLPGVRAQLSAKRAQLKAAALELGWADVPEDQIGDRLPPKATRAAAEKLIEHVSLVAEEEKRLMNQAIDVQAEYEQATRALDAAGADQDLSLLKVAKDELSGLLGRRKGDVLLESRKKLTTALLGLEPFKGTADTLRALIPPGLDEANEHLRAVASLRSALEQADQTYQRAVAGLIKCEQDFDLLQGEAQGISGADLEVARTSRQGLWGRLRAGEDIQAIGPSYEASVLAADQVADRRFEKARAAHELDAIQTRQRQLQEERQAAEAQRSRADDDIRSLQARWEGEMAARGLPGLKPESVQMWLDRRLACLTVATELDRLSAEQADVQRAIDLACAGIRALKPDLPAELTPEMMVSAVAVAVEASARNSGSRTSLVKAADAARTKAEKLRGQHGDAKERLQSAVSRWNAATADIGLGERDPEMGRQLLKLMSDMSTLQGEADELRSRVEPMDQTIQAFETEVRRLGVLVNASIEGLPLEAQVYTLASVAESERESRRAIKALKEQIQKEAQHKLESDESVLSRRSELKELFELAGVSEPSELLAAAQAAQTHADLTAEVARLRAQVLSQGEGGNLDSLLEQVDRENLQGLPIEESNLNEEITRLTQEVTEAYSRLESARRAFNELGGSSKAAEAEADRQMALSDMQASINRYVRVRSGAVILKWALKKYREQAQGPMLERAGHLFSLITDGAFVKLEVDYDSDKPALLGIRRNAASAVGIAGMSEGTRDALYLSLRLAAIELHLRERPPAVIIADDLFINLDDRRAQAGFRALAEVAKRSQVIYLTHHDHLAPLVETAAPGVNKLRIGREGAIQ